MSKIKKLVLGSLFLAMLIVLERLVSFQAWNLRISAAFVPIVLSGTLLGPAHASLIAALGDMLGMLLFPKGAYFPGFTLSAALTGLVYGIFLHKTTSRRQFLERLIISNLLVLTLISTGLTTLWIAITMKKAFLVLLPTRVITAAVRFPVETATIFALKVFLEQPVRKYLYDEDVSADGVETVSGDAEGDGTGDAGGEISGTETPGQEK